VRAVAYLVPTFWTRGSGKKLRGNPEAQTLALYLVSAPASNLIGLYYQPLTTILHETGLTEAEFREAMAKVSEVDIAHYDPEACMVWVPESAKYQIGDTMTQRDKRRAGVERELELAGSHPFVAEFLKRYGAPFGIDSKQNETVPETKLEGASGTQEGASADAATTPPPPLPPRSGSSGSDLDLPVRSGHPEPSPDERIPCPPDLKLLDSQVASLEVSPMVPRWAIDQLVAAFAGKYAGDPNDRRTIGDWRKGAHTAVCGNWNNAAKRPQRPTEDTDSDAQERRRRADEVEARALAVQTPKRSQRGAGAA
jgi:hypothetical protein